MSLFSVAEKLNIKWVSLNATVLSSSRLGLDYDRVKILHEIGLESPLLQDESFLVPPTDRPIDVRTVFPDGNITNFAGQRFKDLNDELNKYKEAMQIQNVVLMDELHALMRSTAMLSPVLFRQNTQVLTFEYELALYPIDNIFNLSLLAPMPSFNVTPGGQVTTVVHLPGANHPSFKTSLLEARGIQLDAEGNETSQEVQKIIDGDYGLRHIIVWHWQNDPLFKIRYQYV